MAISNTAAPAPAWLRELADARASYQERFGWPVSVQVGRRSLVVALGQVVDALTMPAGLGARVRARLAGPVPVFANPDGTRWTFLVEPDPESRPPATTGAELEFAPPGSYVAIPAEMSSPAGHWIESPRPNRTPPPAGTVVALAHILAGARVLGRAG